MKHLLLFAFASIIVLSSCQTAEPCGMGNYGEIIVTNYSEDMYTIHYKGKSLFQLGPDQTYSAGDFDAGTHYLFASSGSKQHEWNGVVVESCQVTYLSIPKY